MGNDEVRIRTEPRSRVRANHPTVSSVVLVQADAAHRAAHPHTALEVLNEASPAARIAQAAVIVAVVIAVFLLPMALGILVGHLLYTWFGLKVLAIVAGYATTFVVMYWMSLCSIESPARPLWLPGYGCD